MMAPTIVVIDTDSTAAQVTTACAQRMWPGAVVYAEPTLERGLLTVQRVKPDILIIDPAEAHVNAEALIRTARSISPALQIIVLASSPRPGLQKALERAGINAYLEKPAVLQLQAFETIVQASLRAERSSISS